MTDSVKTWEKFVDNLNNRQEVTEDVTVITEDREAYMMLTELRSIADKAEQVIAEIEADIKEFDDVEYEAWLQSKVTKCNDYMNTVFDYMMYSEEEDEEDV